MAESCESARIPPAAASGSHATAMRPQARRRPSSGRSRSIAWRRWYRPEPDVLYVAIAAAGSGLSRAYSALFRCRNNADSARMTVAPCGQAVSPISSRYAHPGWLVWLWLSRVAGGGDWAAQPALAQRGGPGGEQRGSQKRRSWAGGVRGEADDGVSGRQADPGGRVEPRESLGQD